ncbi:hypothetical protein [Lentzea sp. HUAS12]|uniref:hypothetical protein n=1 Tax=Lentzea sp. HUAS12 TaxID=2951806 RepID=UPI00209D1981|nr:hypothetical protein [Lentzea sp. HUAS12]USX50024.1 hypothetical protein ND450_32180 [Lentzea sp. HUAS12]
MSPPEIGEHALNRHGYMAGRDADRLADDDTTQRLRALLSVDSQGLLDGRAGQPSLHGQIMCAGLARSWPGTSTAG